MLFKEQKMLASCSQGRSLPAIQHPMLCHSSWVGCNNKERTIRVWQRVGIRSIRPDGSGARLMPRSKSDPAEELIASFAYRTGSSDEVALLIAEFGLLDGELASLLEAVQEGHAARLDDDNLARLAVDIPDLRNRLGIGCETSLFCLPPIHVRTLWLNIKCSKQSCLLPACAALSRVPCICREAMVFYGSGWTVVKVQAAVAESFDKVREGIMFFSRGIRLLGSDVSSAGRLFSRAVLGEC